MTSTNQTGWMHDNPNADEMDKLEHLDAAVACLMGILREAQIAHYFIGGYAANLLRSSQTPEDIHVVTEKPCDVIMDLLLRYDGYSQKDDRCMIYNNGKGDLAINIYTGDTWQEEGYRMPAADASRIFIRECTKPGRNIPTEVPILQPGALVLLDIIVLGNIAQGFLTREAKARHRKHYRDMYGILHWMRDHRETIIYEWFNETPRHAIVWDVAMMCWYGGARELLADTANITVLAPELTGDKNWWIRFS
ncbi:hypothetical protein N7493_005340 [Penicillium malachiteum]|uniref:Uncharacterized protein n=1 Tax=Penicillium malachiteum TaxID=1324776 RepID=A0AAD6HN04_9EURO|nr:hypothetical protein N7493_005340 [Penicillium malachiteum]